MKMPVWLYLVITVHQQDLDPNLWLLLQWDMCRMEDKQEKAVVLLVLNTNESDPAAL